MSICPRSPADPRPYSPLAARCWVASDLGAGPGPGTIPPRRWLSVARQIREAGRPLVVLVPGTPARWPSWARGRLTLVHRDH